MLLKLKKWASPGTSRRKRTCYCEACLEEGADDPVFITAALGTIARARGMSEVARKTP